MRMRTFSSAEFVESQNAVAAAAMDYKVRQRELLGMIYEALEIPTREEMDDLYLSLHALKREVRSLRREARSLRRQVEAQAPAGAPARATKPAKPAKSGKSGRAGKPGGPAKPT